MDAAKQAALSYNLLPSLHVTFALTTAAALAPFGGPRWKTVIWSWSLLIAASTLFTHQHHVADVLAGAVLSVVMMRSVYPSIASSQPISSDT
jgi:membrane-associated phospholipid phosphatase